MTTVIITGIAGFVGSHLAEYLVANTDWEVCGLMRWGEPTDNLETLAPQINRGERVRLVEGDLTDAHSIEVMVDSVRPDYVFHLAAQSYVQASFSRPEETIRTNMIGTLNLLESVLRCAPEAWFHNCSSSEVYGRASGRLDESAPFHASSPYSVSKIAADFLGRYYAQAYGLRVLTTRMFTHTGPRRGDVFAESSFAKQIAMIEAGQLWPIPTIKVGNLTSVRTVADVRDAVRAYHMLLTVNPVPGEVYNIGGNYTCTVGEILATLQRVANSAHEYEVEIDPDRLRPLDADHQVSDCTKFFAHTGWEPTIPFERTMKDLLDYWRQRVRRGVPLQR